MVIHIAEDDFISLSPADGKNRELKMDIRQLAENLGLEEEECLELIELFIETGMSDLNRLQSAIQEGSAEKAINAAHSLKGAALNLGLTELSEIAKEIEEKAGNDRLERTAEPARLLQERLDVIVDLVRR